MSGTVVTSTIQTCMSSSSIVSRFVRVAGMS